MTTPTRIYLVSNKDNISGHPRLVRAATMARALHFVAADTLAIGVATQDDLVDLTIVGVRVEEATTQFQIDGADQPAVDDKTLPLFDEEAAGPTPTLVKPKQLRMPAKYRCAATGSTWSGRGLKPTWLRVALDSGRALSEFAVGPGAAESADA